MLTLPQYTYGNLAFGMETKYKSNKRRASAPLLKYIPIPQSVSPYSFHVATLMPSCAGQMYELFPLENN